MLVRKIDDRSTHKLVVWLAELTCRTVAGKQFCHPNFCKDHKKLINDNHDYDCHDQTLNNRLFNVP